MQGHIVDFCKASLYTYNTALLVVLGCNLEVIVVDEEKTAIDCIEYLSNQCVGQATFIPLDTIQVKMISLGLSERGYDWWWIFFNMNLLRGQYTMLVVAL